MFNILRHYGVPIKIVNVIEIIYHNSQSVVLVDNDISKEFDLTTDILQRDILAPFLFVIVIEYVMKNAQKEHTNGKGESGLITSLRQSSQQPATTIPISASLTA